jgi:hypothetical protein
MAEFIATIILSIFAIYLGMGVLFVIPFQIKGLQKIDENIHGSTIGFRMIIVPGCILFWPLLLARWLDTVKKGKARKESSTHHYH